MSVTDERDKYRDVLLKGRDNAGDSYDEWMMKLSGGALAIALGFVRTSGQPQATGLLVASWVLFTLSLLMMLLSFRTSHHAHQKALEQVDDQLDEGRIWRETPGGHHAKATAFLNHSAGALLIVGLILLGYFVATNLGNLR